ncbi:serine carboxypeptidase S28-domain-containing protein [Lentinula aciculospora]|uniref:Serine carboxypeptidase S28-domain-containing protein n=1 Tax=Lentinula aciculospora TaxID=153920 RepID=A0A9W9AI64_9AGAR|nr:serine carboxypeptidase S28-domain-containing protein [Lentinula aciculospora]
MIIRIIVVATLGCLAHAISPNLLRLGPQGVNLWKLNQLHGSGSHKSRYDELSAQDASGQQPLGHVRDNKPEFTAYWFEQPLDHFGNSTNDTFMQRYWINTRHYQPGTAVVFLLDGGETNGEARLRGSIDRIPFLDTGIMEILARATGGLGVVLEHRYYGESIATKNLTTDSLRFLNNAQSAADSANFMANVQFPDIKENLTAPGTPWIYYGGSYAGARAAHMRVLYPELVYGAIASSAVTHAAIINWEYMDIIRRYADPTCSTHLQKSIGTIDSILDRRVLSTPLKALFGVHGLKHDVDFVSLIESPLGSWQAKVWDPKVGSTNFDEFCAALNKPLGHKNPGVTLLEHGHPDRMLSLPGGLKVDLAIVNYGTWIKEHVVSKCPEGFSHEECFGTFDDAHYKDTSLSEIWRLWLFQVCTEWGYFTTAPPDPTFPRIISKRIDLEYESKMCRQAYDPGEHFTVSPLPNVTVVNELGDFDIAMDRLAFIDGEVDPWRPDTPHSDYANEREDTMLRPFKIIPNGVHHYDEYGLKNLEDEPPEIRNIHEEMIAFVREWLKDWKTDKQDQ